jgi:hypothetical protein
VISRFPSTVSSMEQRAPQLRQNDLAVRRVGD